MFYNFRLPECRVVWIIYTIGLPTDSKNSPTKCAVMHLNTFRKKKEHLTVDAVYSICVSTLPVVSTITDLGVS